jgi:hypothetical protein
MHNVELAGKAWVPILIQPPIYNADETDLYWEKMQSSTFLAKRTES